MSRSSPFATPPRCFASGARARLRIIPKSRKKPEAFEELDAILASADISRSPWREVSAGECAYEPDYATLKKLLAVPIKGGHATKQRSGRVAKSLDAYVAHELRRAGFDPSSVFPRLRRPRVLAPELAGLERAIDELKEVLAEYESESGYLKPVALRRAILRIVRELPGVRETKVLGRGYVKQVDAVVLADWLRGPDVLVSGKTQFSSYPNNKNNRYEEAIGEALNLRDRYPLAAMGFAYVVRSNIFDVKQGGAFALLQDLLTRVRRPDGPFDATVLLVVDWHSRTRRLKSVKDPVAELSLPGFFEDLLRTATKNTPVDVFEDVRARMRGVPAGGFPPSRDP
jgi:hypothetical protein